MEKGLTREEIRKLVMKYVLLHPLTLTPMALGLMLVLLPLLFGVGSLAVLGFWAIATVFGAGGVYMTMLSLNGEKISKKIITEFRTQQWDAEERKYTAIERELTTDGDDRTERYLRDLRTLVNAFRECDWFKRVDPYESIEITETIDTIFNRSVESLLKTLELYKMAQKLGTKSVQKEVMAQREQIITEIRKNVDELAETLSEIQRSDVKRIGVGGFEDSRERLGNLTRQADSVQNRVDQYKAGMMSNGPEIGELERELLREEG